MVHPGDRADQAGRDAGERERGRPVAGRGRPASPPRPDAQGQQDRRRPQRAARLAEAGQHPLQRLVRHIVEPPHPAGVPQRLGPVEPGGRRVGPGGQPGRGGGDGRREGRRPAPPGEQQQADEQGGRQLHRRGQPDTGARPAAPAGRQQQAVDEDESKQHQVHLAEAEGVPQRLEQGQQAQAQRPPVPVAAPAGPGQDPQDRRERGQVHQQRYGDRRGPAEQGQRQHGHGGERRIGEAVHRARHPVVVDPAAVVRPGVHGAVVHPQVEEAPQQRHGRRERGDGGHQQQDEQQPAPVRARSQPCQPCQPFQPFQPCA